MQLPQQPPKNKPNLAAMRRQLIESMWLDYKLFGYTTETVKQLQRKIIRAKLSNDPPQINPNGLPKTE